MQYLQEKNTHKPKSTKVQNPSERVFLERKRPIKQTHECAVIEIKIHAPAIQKVREKLPAMLQKKVRQDKV